MRNPSLIIAALLCLIGSSPGQDGDEIAALRKYLRVPEGVAITVARSPRLPSERPLRVYIVTQHWGVPKEVMQLIQDLNKKEADKYGTIEIALEAATARLWLVHFEVRGTRRKDTETSNSVDPSIGRVQTDPSLGRGQTFNVLKAEVRGYVIDRKPDGLEILSRYKREVRVGDTREELRDAFLKLLKDQSRFQRP